jgi:hypothetical protein
MTAWTVTRTQRYRAAIEGAGITDWLSFIPTSDIAQVDYDARLQERDPTPFLQFSAVMFADRVTTPLLILHGEADRRVPTFQGRELYVLRGWPNNAATCFARWPTGWRRITQARPEPAPSVRGDRSFSAGVSVGSRRRSSCDT